MTAIDPVFKHPTAYMWSAGVQREIPLNFIVDVTYVGRRGAYLQRERDINQPLAGTDPGESGRRTSPRFDRSRVTGQIRLSENAGYSKYNSLQVSAERRYKNGFKFSVAYTLGHSEDNASSKRDIHVQQPTTTRASGATRASTAAMCSRSRTSTICRSTASRQASQGRYWAAGRLQGPPSCEPARRCG